MSSRLAAMLGVFVLSLFAVPHALAQGSIFSTLSGTVVDAGACRSPAPPSRSRTTAPARKSTWSAARDGGFTAPNISERQLLGHRRARGIPTTTLSSVSSPRGIPAAVKVDAAGRRDRRERHGGRRVGDGRADAVAGDLDQPHRPADHSLPLTSRNALDSLTSLPGFNTSGTARNSTVSGLPRSAINITLDGMSVQDNYLKTTDGYFARLSPLLDSVEEVTVTTAGNTADATGQGAVQIRFVTKAGTNKWNGTAYEYLRHDALNANTWFRNRDLPPDPETGKAPKTELRNYQQGFAQGGPISRNKAFFFFNYEEQRRPSSSTLQRIILTPEAAAGVFSYNAAGGVQQRQPAEHRGRERPARDARSDRRQNPRRHPGVDGARPAA